MKFHIEKEKLVKILTKITSIYNEQSDIEILECLYLEVIDNNLTLKATNLMCKMICNALVENSSEGKTVVNFKSLYSIVKNLSVPKLLIYIDNNQLVIKTSTKKFTISTYSPDNFPEIIIENGDLININTTNFIKILPKFDKIFGKDFPINHLCFISQNDCIELVGTNGNRLNYCKFKNETGKDFKILIDDKSISILKNFLKAGEAFNYEIGNREFIVYNDNSKLIVNFNRDFKFPGYEFLLNIKYENEISIKKSELEEALKLLLANLKEDKLIFINIKGNEFIVTYKSSNFSNFECEQIINIESNKEILIKLSAEHLLESIKNAEDIVKLNFNDKNTPLKIVSNDYVGFITLCNI